MILTRYPTEESLAVLNHLRNHCIFLERLTSIGGRGRKSTRPGVSVVVELSPFEFLDKLAALVPPRKHRHRYHGVFAPNHKLRSAVTALAIANVGKPRDAATGGHAAGQDTTGDWRRIQPGQSRLLLLMILAARPTLAEVPLADLSFKHVASDEIPDRGTRTRPRERAAGGACVSTAPSGPRRWQ